VIGEIEGPGRAIREPVDQSDDAGPTLVTRLRFLRRQRREDIQCWDGRKLRYIGAWRAEAEDRKNTLGGQGAHGCGYCSV
jgi:hypothetical protein